MAPKDFKRRKLDSYYESMSDGFSEDEIAEEQLYTRKRKLVNRVRDSLEESSDSSDESCSDRGIGSSTDDESEPEEDARLVTELDGKAMYWCPAPLDPIELLFAQGSDRCRVLDSGPSNLRLFNQASSGQIDLSHSFWKGLDDMTCQQGFVHADGTILCTECRDISKNDVSFWHGISLTSRADSRLCSRCRRPRIRMNHPLTCKMCVYFYYCHREELMAGQWINLSRNGRL